jgi:hypothetical protein
MAALLSFGCGGADEPSPPGPAPRIGTGPRYRPPPGRLDGRSRGGPLRCKATPARRFGVHLEIFAKRLDLVIPAGIGIAPPHIREGAYVIGGRCSYPVRTVEPTGLLEVEEARALELGDFFDLWSHPLSRRRLVGFRARRGDRVHTFVNGREWRGDPRRVPLTRHDAIVLEVAGYFPPTRRYVFPPGL